MHTCIMEIICLCVDITHMYVYAYMKRQCSRKKHWEVMTPNIVFLKKLHHNISKNVAIVFIHDQNQSWSILKFYIQRFYISKTIGLTLKDLVWETVYGVIGNHMHTVGVFWLAGWLVDFIHQFDTSSRYLERVVLNWENAFRRSAYHRQVYAGFPWLII